jgi:fused signal recognition particle receptor
MIEGILSVSSLVSSLASSSDVVIGLAIAIPVAVVAGGVAMGLRLRGRGIKEHVPLGEDAIDAPTDVELDRNADATRAAEGTPAPTGPSSTSVVEIEERPVGAEQEKEPEPAPSPTPEPAEPVSYRSRLGKARGLFAGYLGAVRSKGKIDATTWDDLEEALIRADVGVGATDALLGDLRTRVKEGEIDGPGTLIDTLKSDLVEMLTSADGALALPGSAQEGAAGIRGEDSSGSGEDGNGSAEDSNGSVVDVWLFVGVNGVGKTTTVGKMASRMSSAGTKVLLAAGDTFRAAAGEQLSMWASRADAEIVRGSEGGDPSSVVFDAVQRASSRGYEVVLADTAGRLHNKVNLIEELKKIRRVADRPPGRVVEVLLVLDATTGQNGLAQAKVFLDAVDVSGVVLTKLDGTAKGGIVVAIQRELGLPVKLVGLGEGVDDLVDFDAQGFVEALF